MLQMKTYICILFKYDLPDKAGELQRMVAYFETEIDKKSGEKKDDFYFLFQVTYRRIFQFDDETIIAQVKTIPSIQTLLNKNYYIYIDINEHCLHCFVITNEMRYLIFLYQH